MKKEKTGNEILLYSAILVACILAVFIMLATDLNPKRSSFDMYFSDFPKQIREGQSISFSVVIDANDSQTPLTLSILLDGVEQKNMTLANRLSDKLNFTIDKDFKTGETHEVMVSLYDGAKTYHEYGSASTPYYIFFRVDVV
jgi:hypothetical protein